MHRLVRRSPLFPDESLLSYVIRLAHLNGYRPPESLLTLCLQGQSLSLRSTDIVTCPTNPAVLEQFAQLTGASVTMLYDATAHRFGQILTPPGMSRTAVSIGGETLCLMPSLSRQHVFRPVTASQFCPLCLQEGVYHRVGWLLVSVTVCLDHLCLLMDCCPYCTRPVDLGAIVENRCPKCREDLTNAQPISVAHDQAGIAAHRLLHGWLFGVSDSATRDDIGLPDQPDRVLYHLVDGICTGLRTANPSWSYLHPASDSSASGFIRRVHIKGEWPPDVLYRLYVTAVKSVLAWPNGFYEFLHAYPSRKSPSKARHWFGQLDNFYATWILKNWQHPAFQFVQDAFAWYVQEYGTIATSRSYARRTPQLSQSSRYLSLLEAAHQLGTVPLVVRRLIALGQLADADPDPASRQAGRYVQAQSVTNLLQTWSIPLSVGEAALWLGLPEPLVHNLHAAHFLADVVSQPMVSDAPSMIPKCVVGTWYTMLMVRSSDAHPTEDTVDLATLIEHAEIAGTSMTSLLRAMTAGQLRCYQPLSEGDLMKVQVSTADVRRWQDEVRSGTSRWIRGEEVERRLKTRRKATQRWVEGGLLMAQVTPTGRWIFDRGVFDRFLEQHLWTPAAARAFVVTPIVITQWVQQGRLKAVSGPGIDQNHAYLFQRTTIVHGDVVLEGV